MLNTLRRRWPIVAFVMLLLLGLGAGWAAVATPSYRSFSVVEDPDGEVSSDQYLFAELQASLTANGVDRSEPLTTTIEQDGSKVELVADSDDAALARLAAQLYADVVVDNSRSVQLVTEAEFPLTPRSPNLRIIALVTGLTGALLGAFTALGIDRILRSTDLTPAPGSAPEPSLAPSDLTLDWLPASAPSTGLTLDSLSITAPSDDPTERIGQATPVTKAAELVEPSADNTHETNPTPDVSMPQERDRLQAPPRVPRPLPGSGPKPAPARGGSVKPRVVSLPPKDPGADAG